MLHIENTLDRTERRKAARTVTKQLRRRAAEVAREMPSHAFTANAAFVLDNVPFSNPLHAGKVDSVFQPIEKVMTVLCETGEIECLVDGTPIIRPNNDHHYYPIAEALESMCETFSKLARTHGWADATIGMRKLCKRLELHMPLFQEDVDSARTTLSWMRDVIRTVTPKQFEAESIEVRIRDEFAERGLM